MAKWFGNIGFASLTESVPGVWNESITIRQYCGEITNNRRRLTTSDKVNDDVTISNEFSIIADPFAMNNFHTMRFVEYMGTKWKVTDVEVQYPRLRLTVGGEYNGE